MSFKPRSNHSKFPPRKQFSNGGVQILLSLVLFNFSIIMTSAQLCSPCNVTQNGFAVRPGTNCTEYVDCLNGLEANSQVCTSNLRFDLAILACNWDYLVTCPPDVPCVIPTLPPSPGPTTLASDIAVMEQNIPLKFSIFGLSTNGSEVMIQEDMTTILETILFKLAELESDKSLKILNLTLLNDQRKMKELIANNFFTEASLQTDKHAKFFDTLDRSLEEIPIEMMFTVTVIQKEGIDFGPVIIDGIKKWYDSIVDDIRGRSEYEYITDGFGFNLCTNSDSGEAFDMCSSGGDGIATQEEVISTTMPTASPPSESESEAMPTQVLSETNEAQGSLPIWAIILIVFVSLFLLCCIVSLIFFVGCNKSDMYDENNEKDFNHSATQLVPYDNESGSSSSSSDDDDANHLDYPERCYVDDDDHRETLHPEFKNARNMNGSVFGTESKRSGPSHPSVASFNKSVGTTHRTGSRAESSSFKVHTSQHSVNNSTAYRDSNIQNSKSDPAAFKASASFISKADPSAYKASASFISKADPTIHTRRSASNYQHQNSYTKPHSFYNNKEHGPSYSDKKNSFRTNNSQDQFSKVYESLDGSRESERSLKHDLSKKSLSGMSVVSELSNPSTTEYYPSGQVA